VTAAYLMLHGNGWTQRWQIAPGAAQTVEAELRHVGTRDTSQLTVVDPGSDREATLVVAWTHVVTAVVLDAPASAAPDDNAVGQYA